MALRIAHTVFLCTQHAVTTIVFNLHTDADALYAQLQPLEDSMGWPVARIDFLIPFDQTAEEAEAWIQAQTEVASTPDWIELRLGLPHAAHPYKIVTPNHKDADHAPITPRS